ncbi:pyridoxamine 5'-phosphate oxidase family protein [Winogradskyella alexanderae]|uniref:Pyridoxamine 5'-phosphate oxidase family protein n=1 Tax=Winogradskyella alexanderae TaxID=2877123 RepID=A0ABS7XWG6_9FLAO|nr:pyridoxamine 5'-phosphate oxidase family protein [Winogradskyella alexanderae]MCA0133748.1 pyridoxamine 5'-phosphate oxidase family protein [Winogradskyella alexanderae]
MIKSIEKSQCSEILKNNYLGYLSYISNNAPYTIPITYFYNEKENYIICYSGLGHKINAMRKNITISLAVADIFAAKKWQSVLVHGRYDEISGGTAKLYLHEFSLGIKSIILRKERQDLDYISEFSSKIYNQDVPIVFLIRIDEMTGKMRT